MLRAADCTCIQSIRAVPRTPPNRAKISFPLFFLPMPRANPVGEPVAAYPCSICYFHLAATAIGLLFPLAPCANRCFFPCFQDAAGRLQFAVVVMTVWGVGAIGQQKTSLPFGISIMVIGQ
jgi:hypothetical protein